VNLLSGTQRIELACQKLVVGRATGIRNAPTAERARREHDQALISELLQAPFDLTNG
jgi:hypothetical protein